jgi:hypothetical protein
MILEVACNYDVLYEVFSHLLCGKASFWHTKAKVTKSIANHFFLHTRVM